ncbi:nitrate- and nitrite sensing domain-containing protein [Streptomyces sp. NPDC046203]|uniref:nitrate- and nitrite sensing domain-containing protein n=1 Tax=Streptomyces sp. NPDC046203 TaxID=3154602 RepID=UPI0033CF2CDF
MQGRFKRDGTGSSQARKGRGEAPAEQEPRAGTQHGSPAPHPQNPDPQDGNGPGRKGKDGPGRKAKGRSKGKGGDGPGRPAAPIGPAGPAGPEKSAGGTAEDAVSEHAPLPDLQSEAQVGPRIALRNWRISTRLVALLTLPVVAATSLGGIRISESLQDMDQLEQMQLLTKLTKEATNFAEALQEERGLSAGPLANGKSAGDYQVANPRKKTDRAYKAFLDATKGISDTSSDESLRSIRSNVNQIASQVSALGSIRSTAYEEGIAKSVTVEAYSRLIRSLLSLSQDMAQATSNPEMIKRTRALAAFSSAKEYASIQEAIIASSLPPNDSRPANLQLSDRLYGEAAQNSEDVELKSFKYIYESTGGNSEDLTASLFNGDPSIEAADNYARRLLKSTRGLPDVKRGHLNFTDEYGTKMTAMKRIEADLLGKMETEARELKQASKREAIINGALILLVLGVSLVGAFVVARSMIRSLRRLQDTATKVAQDRLPELVKQLSEADPQDVDTSVESVGVHSRDEIGQVAAAFDEVHREAVRLAAEQALLRGNVNAMFTNLSRRSQGLIQRQLSLISELESREADPDQLSSLFKLDHLATRMRRNGENLLVLAGEEPGRRWTRPVPLVDVLRAAASEVEQYERIELASVPATDVAGRVVNDLVHLLAELLENATSFSSPQTKVRVTGHALPDGRVLVEIHDTGIGLSPEDLAAINERLASPPTVDVSVSRRMGLFVVGRLSLRHGIRIQLRPSDSGGTTALVMLPVDVAHGGKKPAPKAGQPGGQNGAPQGQAPQGGRLAAGPGAAAALGGGRPGGQGAPGGRLGAGPARGALPSRDAQRPNSPQPQGPNLFEERSQAPAPVQAQAQGPGQMQGQGQGQGRPQDRQQDLYQDRGASGPETAQMPPVPAEPQGPGAGAGVPGGFGGGAQSAIPSRTDIWGGQDTRPGQQAQAPQAAQMPQAPQAPQPQQGARPPLEPRPAAANGFPRAELPGGAPDRQAQQPQQAPRPQATSWGNDQMQPVRRPQQDMSPLDAPRGHDDPESTGGYALPGVPDGPGSTGQFARPDFGAPAPQAQAQAQAQAPQGYQADGQDPASTAGFPRPEFGAPQQAPQQQAYGHQPFVPQAQVPQQAQAPYGQPQAQQAPAPYGQPQAQQAPSPYGQPQAQAPVPYAQEQAQAPAPRQRTANEPAPQQQSQQPQLQQPRRPEALPPAPSQGGGEMRTPLFDTLETDWHRQEQGQQAQAPQQPQAQQGRPQHQGQQAQQAQQGYGQGFQAPQPVAPAPAQPQAPAPAPAAPSLPDVEQTMQNPVFPSAEQTAPAAPQQAEAPQQGGSAAWRTSPNDELVRQAERVRKPAAGGVTTSGLPRRVPRANLVPGTAQEQAPTAGPQVSRAPDDVRGRLTNLRRGIQQGRQAGNPNTGSFDLGPNQQQER